jgi:hypothetical protein
MFLRVEHGEWDFLSALDHDSAVPFDAAIVSDRYLAPYPEQHSRHGEPPDRLLDELTALHVPWLLDPDTARLGHHLIAQRSRPRAANSPIARAVPLPLSPKLGLPSGEAEALVDATAGVQLRSSMFASPYLEISGVEDPRFETNIRLLELSCERAGDRVLVAYLQTLSRYMRDGSATAAGTALAAAGADFIVIRIRRFSPETASTENLLAYAQLIAAIESTDASTITDAVGRLGPGARRLRRRRLLHRLVPLPRHPRRPLPDRRRWQPDSPLLGDPGRVRERATRSEYERDRRRGAMQLSEMPGTDRNRVRGRDQNA